MDLLWLIPAAPLIGFLILVATEGRLGKTPVALIGAGAVAVSALAAAEVLWQFAAAPEPTYSQPLWPWIDVAGFKPTVTLYLDGLAAVMVGVITGVGFLIHVYATGYMRDEEGYSRFFAYMNLFVFAMLMLVLGDNLLVLYLGWEGVGLCSYLLIGFFQTDPANGYAARKAFVVTRVGDTAMALGLFLLFKQLGTLDIQAVLTGVQAIWPHGSTTLTIAALLILGGAVGKSAQLPLQTWLPDAMAGPTPVSALIHAATMVTAGVYLIARLHDLYLQSPGAQFAVALVGLVTLLLASFSALTQRDLKRILAYSTMAQIGYMFMALGVGAWSAAIFHLMTHAFFKALLFLSAGSVILALHHEQDIFRMGGLWRRLPLPFACMVIGSAALAAVPLTSGFYSKDAIEITSFGYTFGGEWFWALACLGGFLTALYCTRMIFVVFFGPLRTEVHVEKQAGLNLSVPLALLAVLSIGGGWFGLLPVARVLPDGGLSEHHAGWLPLVTAAIPLAGLGVGYLMFGNRALDPTALANSKTGDRLRRFWLGGWGFDRLYDALIVRPIVTLARRSSRDSVDFLYDALAFVTRGLHRLLALTQTGRLRWYAFNMAAGIVLVLLIGLGVL